jgi:uncharacterized membrane protein
MFLISKFTKSKWWLIVLFPLGILWLIIYPNAPYILTGYAHFSWVGFFRVEGFTLQPWYDFVLFTCFFLSGFLAGLVSLKMIHCIVEKYFGRPIGWFSIIIINFLSGWAIYLGRFIRLNSWDLRTPEILLPHIQLNYEKTVFVVALSVFLILIYVVIYNFDSERHKGECTKNA